MTNSSYKSLTPHYVWAETLEEQEAQLRENPLLQRMIASREAKVGDPHRPFYHYVNPENNLNDPNGLVLLAGQVAPVLSGVSAGGPAGALGSCDQR